MLLRHRKHEKMKGKKQRDATKVEFEAEMLLLLLYPCTRKSA